MIKQEKPYEQFNQLHHQFIDEYKTVSTHVTQLYQLPKQFIEQNAMEMDEYMNQSSIPGPPDSVDSSAIAVKEFIYRIEDFKLQIMSLFFEHRSLIEKCTVYMKKTHEMKANFAPDEKFSDLIPELTALRFGLKCIEEKAGSMAASLKNIESKWNNIKIHTTA